MDHGCPCGVLRLRTPHGKPSGLVVEKSCPCCLSSAGAGPSAGRRPAIAGNRRGGARPTPRPDLALPGADGATAPGRQFAALEVERGAGAADERSSSEGRCRSIRDEPLGGRRWHPEPRSPVSVILSARHRRPRRGRPDLMPVEPWAATPGSFEVVGGGRSTGVQRRVEGRRGRLQAGRSAYFLAAFFLRSAQCSQNSACQPTEARPSPS